MPLSCRGILLNSNSSWKNSSAKITNVTFSWNRIEIQNMGNNTVSMKVLEKEKLRLKNLNWPYLHYTIIVFPIKL